MSVDTVARALAAKAFSGGAGSGGAAQDPYASGGRRYGMAYGFSPVTLAAGIAPTANKLCLHPFMLRAPVTIAQLIINVSTLSSGGKCSIQLHNSDAGGDPGTLIDKVADLSTTVATRVQAALSAGNAALLPWVRYWWGVNCDNATAVFFSVSNTSGLFGSLRGSLVTANVVSTASLACGLSLAKTYGTYDDLTGSTFTELTTAQVAGVGFQTA